VYLAKALSTPGIIRVDAQKPPTVYKLEGSVSVEKLILLDPVAFGVSVPSVPSNVGTVINWYQTKQGNGLFREVAPPHCPVGGKDGVVGNDFSRFISGTGIGGGVNVTSDKQHNYIELLIGTKRVRLYGMDVNHDLLPMFAGVCVGGEF